eukprot:4536562-Amphidinium_carterae.1
MEFDLQKAVFQLATLLSFVCYLSAVKEQGKDSSSGPPCLLKLSRAVFTCLRSGAPRRTKYARHSTIGPNDNKKCS